jgi:flagellar hook protein FlgE
MSINSAMLAGVTGLTANASALAATSDNIANVNTIGYKRNVTEFSNLVTAASNNNYSAGGVQALTAGYVTQQGLLQSTTSPTDLAISGQGFFVTTQSATGLTPTSPRLFTRAGSFTVDNQGFLKNAASLYLQGWAADTNGKITPDPSNISLLQPINVSAVGGAAGATTIAGVNANLNAAQIVSQASTDTVYTAAVPASAGPPAVPAVPEAYAPSAVDGYDPASVTTSMAAYDPVSGTGTKPDFSVTVPLADSQGGARSMQIDFLKSASVPNVWYAEAHVVPASDVTTGTDLIDGQVSTGVVAFTPDGRLDTSQTTLFGLNTPGSNGDGTLSIGASNAIPGSLPTSGQQVWWSAGLGINGQNVTMNLANAAGGITQFNSQSVVQSVATNGTAFGNLTSINIDDSGYVTAAFDNGVTRTIAQVAIATFPNPDGLKSVSGDAYVVSLDSGTYNLKQPGSGGAGSLSASTLEASTVDLSAEFSQLITTQRAYSASSKIITTADQMLQDLINIIR